MMKSEFAGRIFCGILSVAMGVLASSCSSPQSQVQSSGSVALAKGQAEPAGESAVLAGSMAELMLDEINRQRDGVGAEPLAIDRRLMKVAQMFVDDMRGRRYFSHTSPDGHTLKDRLAAEDIEYRVAAENIAQTKGSFADAIALWMKSPGHRANLLDPRLKRIGIARSGDLWAQEFTD